MSNKDKAEARLATLMLKGMLAETPPEFRDRVYEAADKIRAIVTEYGEQGTVGLTLVAAEIGSDE